MKIAITGSTGFIGSSVTRCAIDRGHRVTRIVRPGTPAGRSSDAVIDLDDADGLTEIAAAVDAVIHCAASDDPAFLPLLRRSTDAFLKGLPPGGRFAMQGGSAVFGDTGPDAMRSPVFNPPAPLEPRASFERGVLQFGRSDIYTRIVYGSFVFGGRGAAIPSTLIAAAIETGSALYFGKGQQIWSTVHVDDLGKLLVDAVENRTVPNTELFAAAQPIEIKAVAETIGEVLGCSARSLNTDEEAAQFGPFAAVLTVHQHFSSLVARRKFRWNPEISDNATSIFRSLVQQASRASL
ncbi:NAD-dependent epimerase/dehydratase family protein [Sulfitobacter sp. S190]|uniref:NAD-dependent epimerase/dehydratase family protein n=1 Tax=Sulfitobacter sp. S190 TaxID=2867022 RepID=UPI0021A8E7D9|nr:NAD-dependent epimerase/dehydratase family protein [Sulfitobacter sp. S190]UWR21247.1 NAD-dependent epimerase/dehydratase family protein [Sulfitobacter sp. S190]